MIDNRVPLHVANQPAPTAPDKVRWHRDWLYYLQDLACWKAMKMDCLLDGIADPYREDAPQEVRT